MTGIIDALPVDDYVKDPAPAPSLSASIAHVLLTQSARHAWLKHPRLNAAWKPDATDATDLGSIAHAVLLEGDESRVVVLPQEFTDFRKADARALRDQARAAGKLPILAERMDDVRHMVDVARAALADSELAGLLDGAAIERTLIWQEEGVWCRSRPDVIDAGDVVLCDYKTTGRSAEPDGWARTALLGHGYDLQAALMLRGANALGGPKERKAVFLVQETAPPYAVSLVGIDPQWVVFADARLNAALACWRACLEADRWPAYPSRICWASPPEWAVYRFGERMALTPPDAGEGSVDEL
jgi:hypothetical protein